MIIDEILRTKGRRVVTVTPDASLADAAALFDRNRIGAVVVSRDGRQLEGLLDEGDVVRAVARRGASALTQAVRTAMTADPVVCTPNDRVTRVMALMTDRRQRHLPVLVNNEIAGIVSIGDAVKARLEELELESRVLRDAWLARH